MCGSIPTTEELLLLFLRHCFLVSSPPNSLFFHLPSLFFPLTPFLPFFFFYNICLLLSFYLSLSFPFFFSFSLPRFPLPPPPPFLSHPSTRPIPPPSNPPSLPSLPLHPPSPKRKSYSPPPPTPPPFSLHFLSSSFSVPSTRLFPDHPLLGLLSFSRFSKANKCAKKGPAPSDLGVCLLVLPPRPENVPRLRQSARELRERSVYQRFRLRPSVSLWHFLSIPPPLSHLKSLPFQLPSNHSKQGNHKNRPRHHFTPSPPLSPPPLRQ